MKEGRKVLLAGGHKVVPEGLRRILPSTCAAVRVPRFRPGRCYLSFFAPGGSGSNERK